MSASTADVLPPWAHPATTSVRASRAAPPPAPGDHDTAGRHCRRTDRDHADLARVQPAVTRSRRGGRTADRGRPHWLAVGAEVSVDLAVLAVAHMAALHFDVQMADG